jgi:hypothetical protein
MAEPALEVIDVECDGRWSQVLLMQVSSAAEAHTAAEQVLLARGDVPYVAVVSADLGEEVAEILAALRPGLQEIVCFDSLAEPVVPGQDFAMRTLEELGFGQDFVFTVPALEDAVDHAVATLAAPEHGGWEGRFVVVVGPGPVVERARAHLVEPG